MERLSEVCAAMCDIANAGLRSGGPLEMPLETFLMTCAECDMTNTQCLVRLMRRPCRLLALCLAFSLA